MICCPPGGGEVAHQLINTSADAELRYLAVSTVEAPEVAEYPDSGKVATMLGKWGEKRPDGRPAIRRFFAREEGTLEDYWDGEE